MINIVLVEPEIPQNTGNIARTCACTNTKLHLVKPLGFEISDKTVKRAGLDYWKDVDITYYDNLADFFNKNKGEQFFYLTTKSKKKYCDIAYPDNCFLLFGKETKGLPEDLIFSDLEHSLTIPMSEKCRSLNLSNAVAIVLYEALKQHNFNTIK